MSRFLMFFCFELSYCVDDIMMTVFFVTVFMMLPNVDVSVDRAGCGSDHIGNEVEHGIDESAFLHIPAKQRIHRKLIDLPHCADSHRKTK